MNLDIDATIVSLETVLPEGCMKCYVQMLTNRPLVHLYESSAM